MTLIDFSTGINIINAANARKLIFYLHKTNIGIQKVNELSLKIYNIVIAVF